MNFILCDLLFFLQVSGEGFLVKSSDASIVYSLELYGGMRLDCLQIFHRSQAFAIPLMDWLELHGFLCLS